MSDKRNISEVIHHNKGWKLRCFHDGWGWSEAAKHEILHEKMCSHDYKINEFLTVLDILDIGSDDV